MCGWQGVARVVEVDRERSSSAVQRRSETGELVRRKRREGGRKRDESGGCCRTSRERVANGGEGSEQRRRWEQDRGCLSWQSSGSSSIYGVLLAGKTLRARARDPQSRVTRGLSRRGCARDPDRSSIDAQRREPAVT